MSSHPVEPEPGLFEAPPVKLRKNLLTDNNSNLNRDGRKTYTFSTTALKGTLPSGRTVVTCPEAGVCARLCYARDPRSSYLRYPGVARAHLLNLQMVEETPREWEQWMIAELRKPKFVGAVVRIHDSGDFHTDSYTKAWMRICKSAPRTTFYAYTKAVDRMRRIVDPDKPANFEYTLSLGGKEDHLIDLTRQRHADVFPTVEALDAAGYRDQAEDDRLAVDPDTIRVGMAANRIPRLLELQGDRSFGQLQRDRLARRAALRAADSPDATEG